MPLKEFLFGASKDGSAIHRRKQESFSDDVVEDLWLKGINLYYKGAKPREILFRISASDATALDKKEARRRLRESFGIGTEPTKVDWGC